MKKLVLLIFGMILVCAVGLNAYALPFTFSDSSEGGTGSATMDISVSGTSGTIVTAVLNNTSPITLDDGTGVNAPGITAFGFDLDPADKLDLLFWELTAYEVSGPSTNLITIGGSGPSTGDWQLTKYDNINGIKVDYVPNLKDVKGALYNPDVVLGGGAAAEPNYYTKAILTMIFDAAPSLNIADPDSPIVRMQNVGLDGKGSLKLPGTPVPEPATILLMGTGLLGIIGFGRKRLNKKT